MKPIYAKQTCTMTELREPHKVLEQAKGKPVAIMKNSSVVGYLVPQEATPDVEPRVATLDEVMEAVEQRREVSAPILDYLKDK